MVSESSWDTFVAIVSAFSWWAWLGLAIVFILLCVLSFLIWKRKYSKDADKLEIPELTVPTKLLLPVNSLVEIWHPFVTIIPWRLRRNALSQPFSLVIGDAGSGKSTIIDRYADWQGQEFRFHPSAVDDSLLQIYLGAKSLVLEFGSALLYDTSAEAYYALKRLWRRLPPSPQVLMVIDTTSLLDPQTESLRELGHALFGKLKVFGELEGKSLPLVLALSHMEKVEGFTEFCAFLEEAGIPLQLDFPAGDGITHLESCLDDFQQHLQRALVTRTAQEYLKIVTFINDVPRLFRVLIDFLRVAGLEQGVDAPSVVRLCLLSEQVHSFECKPFALPAGIQPRQRISLNNHAKSAIALALGGLVYFVGSYNYEQMLVNNIRSKIKIVETTPIQYYEEKISPLFLDFSSNLKKNALLSLVPHFFLHAQIHNHNLLIVEIRKYYLLPLLEQIQNEPDATFRNIRFIAMLYSTPTNEIGKILARDPGKFPIDMNKYGLLINDYINHNTNTENLDHLLNAITYNDSNSQDYIQDRAPWLALFRNFQQILQKQFIQDVEFNNLQGQLQPFLHVMDLLDYYPSQDLINEWLVTHTRLQHNFKYKSELRQVGISQLLRLVSNMSLSTDDNCQVQLSLRECLSLVEAESKPKMDNLAGEMLINLGGESFSFTRKQWSDLLSRSRVTMVLRNFIATHKNNDGWIFFSSPSIYENVEMNSSNNGGILFTGNGRIDGRLTIDAFEQNVKPSILGLNDIVTNLPIDANEKKNFNAFVSSNLEAYSDRYVSSYSNYFKGFQINIDSTWGLNYVLHDLQQPNSRLLDVLVQIKKNTALVLPASGGFQSFAQKLTVFRFIQQFMEEKNGIYPEFQKYQLLMAQMQQEMNTHEPYEQKKMVGDSDEALKGALSPLGRLAWAMQLNEDGSYLKLTKMWLQQIGIQAEWQQPFLAPVQKVKEYGTAEINRNIAGIWNDIWVSNVAPLLIKFPFTQNAAPGNELTVDDLVKNFHPKQGLFWDTFHQYLEPLSKFSNGVWIRQHELSNTLVLPTNYLSRLNAIQKLTNKLWDNQGNTKPLEILVKPGLLPTFDNKQIPRAPLVSLAYLRQGNASVLGFNQQAEWQKFPLEWWLAQPAEVGMEFRKDMDPTRVYADMVVDDSNWNLFKLLQRGHIAGTQRYRWPLAHPNFPKQPLNLEFQIQGNPLALFTDLAGS